MKKAFITGVTGQDGSYLAELLLEKGYEVHGLKRRSSSFNTSRIEHIYEHTNFHAHFGDLTDPTSLDKIVYDIQPDEIYNLGAQSHVAVSFKNPFYTTSVNALGTIALLEAAKNFCNQNVRFYQASTSELFGLVQETPQTEDTPFYPRSPYAASKIFAYWIVKNYREAFGMFCCNGILFNHESPRRGETFVTRKITRGLANCYLGGQNKIRLGNLDAKRDWGHAKDYVRMQWLMLQQLSPRDYVISTGEQISVRDFILLAASEIGVELQFEGVGTSEIGKVLKLPENYTGPMQIGQTIIEVDPNYFRPSEVETLLGDSTRARSDLGWVPEFDAKTLAADMMRADLKSLLNKR